MQDPPCITEANMNQLLRTSFAHVARLRRTNRSIGGASYRPEALHSQAVENTVQRNDASLEPIGDKSCDDSVSHFAANARIQKVILFNMPLSDGSDNIFAQTPRHTRGAGHVVATWFE